MDWENWFDPFFLMSQFNQTNSFNNTILIIYWHIGYFLRFLMLDLPGPGCTPFVLEKNEQLLEWVYSDQWRNYEQALN